MSQPNHYTLQINYVDRPAETRRVEAKRVVIGRDGGDIILNDSQSSSTHAEIEFENGQLVVRDLGSTNGTWLGQRNLGQFALSPGQVFRCGHTQIRLLEIVGGQQRAKGRTVMADASELPAMPTGAPSAPAPAATAPPKSGPSAGMMVAAGLGAVVLLGAAATAGWYLFLREAPETEIAETEPVPGPEPEPQPEPEPEPELKPELIPDKDEVLVDDDPDLGEIYRRVGAATVVIRVPGSVGSGVVIDDSGLILTNHHVIEGGTHNGLSVEAKVVFGVYSDELKTFEPQHEQVEATVMKVDVDHDLALIKLDEPPAELTAVPVAEENPHPGQRVAAIGHAGVGMLWAIKAGEISAAGSLAGHTDLLLDANEGDREFLEERKKRFEKMGRVIQSTAKILPGDSGGPLVNLDGEIVGVNAFGRIDHSTNQWLSFHIHLAEVRAFLAEMPTRPLAMVPDPWDDAGPWTRVDDANLDGKADVLLVDGSSDHDRSWANWGVLVDLDGDSFDEPSAAETGEGEDGKAIDFGDGSPAAVNAKIEELVEREHFDAEFAMLREMDGACHFWYDTDGVDGYDLYLLDKHGCDNPTDAWHLDKLGGAEKIEDELELDDGLRPELFTKPELALAFGQIGAVVFPGQVTSSGAGGGALPPPEHHVDGAEVTFHDGNGDGLNDLVIETSAFDSRAFYDLDQNSIGRTTSADALKVLLDVAKVDSELALIRQGANAWLWYDRDDDGSFDLVLVSHDFERGTVEQAFTLASPEAEPEPAPEHVGRRLFRPALLAKSDLASRLTSHSSIDRNASAIDEGLGSFPSLERSLYAAVLVDDKVAIVTDEGHDLTLIDVDGNSSSGSSVEVAAQVRAGDYDAEFALLVHHGVRWAFYDRDNDGSFDWVLVSVDDESDTTTHGFAISGASTTYQADLVGRPLIDASHFSESGIRSQFDALAGEAFADDSE